MIPDPGRRLRKTNSNPKRKQVSLRREVYEKLKAEAKRRGMTITDMLHLILTSRKGDDG